MGSTIDFGQALADFAGAKYGVAVSNGTAALHLSVMSLGIGPGDEVITTPMTFCATANAVLYQGADVKFVDIDEKTLNIDSDLIEPLWSPGRVSRNNTPLYFLQTEALPQNHSAWILEH